LLRSRAGALVAFAVIALAGALIYAGPSAPIVVYRLLVDGGMVLVWLIAAAGFGSWILAWIDAGEPTPRAMASATVLGLGLGLISLATLGLGLAAWLNRATAVALIAAGIVLAAARLLQMTRGHAISMAWLREPAGWDWLWLAACPFAAISLIAAMFPPGILWRRGDPSFYDVVEYHLQVPREWFESGRIVPLSHNVFSFFPFNVEMHYLLAMHLRGGPWAGMYVAQLMHLSFVVLFVSAVYGFALQIAARLSSPKSKPLPAIIAALAIATVPWVTQLAPIAYDEGGFLLFATLAIAWTHQAIFASPKRTRRLALAGVFAGLACGAKLTAVPEVLLPLAAGSAMLIAWNDRGKIAASLRGGAVLLVVGLVTFSPWLVRNFVWAHNPLFPEAANVLGPGDFTPTQIERWDRAHDARPDQRALSGRLRAGWNEILASPQYGYVIIPLAMVGIWFGRRRRETLLFAGMLLVLALIWLFATHLQGRFFVLALPLCAVLIAQIDRPVPMLIALIAVLIAAGISGMQLHHDITAYLLGGDDSPLGGGVVGILGIENIGEIESAYLKDLPSDADVVLVGDAKAFWYAIPMSRLHYRTVFDVRGDDGENVINAWNGGPPPANARIIVDPGELERFHDTYWEIAPPAGWMLRDAPRDAAGRPLPFVLSGGPR